MLPLKPLLYSTIATVLPVSNLKFSLRTSDFGHETPRPPSTVHSTDHRVRTGHTGRRVHRAASTLRSRSCTVRRRPDSTSHSTVHRVPEGGMKFRLGHTWKKRLRGELTQDGPHGPHGYEQGEQQYRRGILNGGTLLNVEDGDLGKLVLLSGCWWSKSSSKRIFWVFRFFQTANFASALAERWMLNDDLRFCPDQVYFDAAGSARERHWTEVAAPFGMRIFECPLEFHKEFSQRKIKRKHIITWIWFLNV